jgi:acyl dehydratase/NAD(P)-dependent dehydrogenase (short-subunit alcohol dehydrogenase family)
MDRRVVSRTFTQAGQQWFAALSGDSNPLHMDQIEARRTQVGLPVVHGMHTLLWALDCIASASPGGAVPSSIRVDFTSFLFVGQTASLSQLTDAPNRRATVSAAGLAIMTVELRYGTQRETKAGVLQASPEDVLTPDRPFELEMADLAMQRGAVGFATEPTELEAAFPAAAAWLRGRRLTALACCSRLVGMVCPGLHSIFNRVDVNLVDEGDAPELLKFSVTNVDLRFRNVRMAVTGGGILGTLVATARQPPTRQPSMSEISGSLEPGSFAGAKALVVGGSRGLGELTAKILAAGGADIIITYAKGRADGDRVATEINAWGGHCEAFHYDALRSAAAQLTDRINSITHCYYFATPTIFRPSACVFVKDRFHEFVQFYVDGFYDLCAAFQAEAKSGVRIFYPSSIFVGDLPVGMSEYVMAKAAGEVLCNEINQSFTGIGVVCSRLPRIATDQTVSLLSKEFAAAVDVMLPVVQLVQSGGQPAPKSSP